MEDSDEGKGHESAFSRSRRPDDRETRLEDESSRPRVGHEGSRFSDTKCDIPR